MNQLDQLRKQFKQLEKELKTLQGTPAYHTKKYELLNTYEKIQKIRWKSMFWHSQSMPVPKSQAAS